MWCDVIIWFGKVWLRGNISLSYQLVFFFLFFFLVVWVNFNLGLGGECREVCRIGLWLFLWSPLYFSCLHLLGLVATDWVKCDSQHWVSRNKQKRAEQKRVMNCSQQSFPMSISLMIILKKSRDLILKLKLYKNRNLKSSAPHKMSSMERYDAEVCHH